MIFAPGYARQLSPAALLSFKLEFQTPLPSQTIRAMVSPFQFATTIVVLAALPSTHLSRNEAWESTLGLPVIAIIRKIRP